MHAGYHLKRTGPTLGRESRCVSRHVAVCCSFPVLSCPEGSVRQLVTLLLLMLMLETKPTKFARLHHQRRCTGKCFAAPVITFDFNFNFIDLDSRTPPCHVSSLLILILWDRRKLVKQNSFRT